MEPSKTEELSSTVYPESEGSEPKVLNLPVDDEPTYYHVPAQEMTEQLADGFYVWRHKTDVDNFFPCLIQFGEEMYICGDDRRQDLDYHMEHGTFTRLMDLLPAGLPKDR